MYNQKFIPILQNCTKATPICSTFTIRNIAERLFNGTYIGIDVPPSSNSENADCASI
jgi:hypothetical protein